MNSDYLNHIATLKPRGLKAMDSPAPQVAAALMEQLGNPHLKLPVIHIAGSKGKGSTALTLEALLASAGLRCGTFTSPHLNDWNERIRLYAKPVRDDIFQAALDRVQAAAEAVTAQRNGDCPRFFEILTATGLLIFSEAKLDCAVIECGMGGHGDATNFLSPLVTGITGVELEHREHLGETLAEIAWQKAGIARAGRAMIIGKMPADAMRTVEQHCEEIDAPIVRTDTDWGYRLNQQTDSQATISITGPERFELHSEFNPLGEHQAANAILAVALARNSGLVSNQALKKAALEVFPMLTLPGRCEIISRQPLLLIDSAHTQASASALAKIILAMPQPPGTLVFSSSTLDHLEATAEHLIHLFDRIIVTRANTQRSMPAEDVAAWLCDNFDAIPLEVEADPVQALTVAEASTRKNALTCAAGSVYLAGIARSVWGMN